MPSKPEPGLTRMHQEMNSEAASSGSPLRAAVPPKRAKGESRTEGSDEPNHARSGWDKRRTGKDKKGAGRGD